MNTATIASRYHFTVAELEKMTDTDIGRIHAEAQDQRGADRFEKWHEAIFFSSDPLYRQNRIREERGLPPLDNKSKKPPAPAPEPEPAYPMFAPQPTIVRSGLTREDISALVGPIKRHVREKISAAVAGLASASIVAQQGNRITELENRILSLEKRLAGADNRLNAHSKHLSNIEQKIREGS